LEISSLEIKYSTERCY